MGEERSPPTPRQAGDTLRHLAGDRPGRHSSDAPPAGCSSCAFATCSPVAPARRTTASTRPTCSSTSGSRLVRLVAARVVRPAVRGFGGPGHRRAGPRGAGRSRGDPLHSSPLAPRPDRTPGRRLWSSGSRASSSLPSWPRRCSSSTRPVACGRPCCRPTSCRSRRRAERATALSALEQCDSHRTGPDRPRLRAARPDSPGIPAAIVASGAVMAPATGVLLAAGRADERTTSVSAPYASGP